MWRPVMLRLAALLVLMTLSLAGCDAPRAVFAAANQGYPDVRVERFTLRDGGVTVWQGGGQVPCPVEFALGDAHVLYGDTIRETWRLLGASRRQAAFRCFRGVIDVPWKQTTILVVSEPCELHGRP